MTQNEQTTVFVSVCSPLIVTDDDGSGVASCARGSALCVVDADGQVRLPSVTSCDRWALHSYRTVILICVLYNEARRSFVFRLSTLVKLLHWKLLRKTT